MCVCVRAFTCCISIIISAHYFIYDNVAKFDEFPLILK